MPRNTLGYAASHERGVMMATKENDLPDDSGIGARISGIKQRLEEITDGAMRSWESDARPDECREVPPRRSSSSTAPPACACCAR